MPEYTELFEIAYTGQVSDLEEALEETPGVEAVGSISETSHRQVDTDLEVELTYDSYETDRSSISAYLERDVEGVNSVISA